MSVPLDSSKRNCYCHLWQTDPEHLTERNIPYGYCGICNCGEYGHLRHAPNAPYTAEFCDQCYRLVAMVGVVKMGFFLLFILSLVLTKWIIAGILLVIVVVLHLWEILH